MELQKFIDENSDYLSQFKDYKLHVRKYSQLGLSIVKSYRNNNYNYEENPWLRYCRGVIINTNTNRVVCIPPMKADREDDINGAKYELEKLIQKGSIKKDDEETETDVSSAEHDTPAEDPAADEPADEPAETEPEPDMI